MNQSIAAATFAALVTVSASPLLSAEGTGVQRATSGATATVTSPVKIVEGVQQDTAAYGPVGVVTGSVKGGARAAGQAVTGALDVGVGVVEAIAAPLTTDK